ncbi:MAG: tartrate dehydrogenase [Dehalococcoidales bacterium]|nr:tartrate dehydrogenase [Dehalococcoidales bacterium]
MAHRIAVIPGDNVGPEVVGEGLKVLRALADRGFGPFSFTEFPWGAGHYLKTGLAMPEDGLEILDGFGAILLGAVGDPRRVPDSVGSQGLIQKVRKGFQLYVNLRPIRLLPGVVSPIRGKDHIDFVVVRENTEGEYSPIGGRLHAGTPNELAMQTTVITRVGAERIMRFAFELARKRNGKKRVTAATKSNALCYVMTLWDEVFAAVAKDYPDVETNKYHIDAFTMNLIRQPEWFDVVVATNLYGDILSDEGAIIAGSLGMAPGANLDPTRCHPSIFEPIHGSAPDIAGRGIANPVATIQAVQLMLDWLGEVEAARLVGAAVETVLAEGRVRTRDLGGDSSTSEMGDAICAKIVAG